MIPHQQIHQDFPECFEQLHFTEFLVAFDQAHNQIPSILQHLSIENVRENLLVH